MFSDPSLTTPNAVYLMSHFYFTQLNTHTFILTEIAKPKASYHYPPVPPLFSQCHDSKSREVMKGKTLCASSDNITKAASVLPKAFQAGNGRAALHMTSLYWQKIYDLVTPK